MNVLITAGGTSEYIDAVRRITNTSTGRLATHIYKHFMMHNNEEEQVYVHYVKSRDAMLPDMIDSSRTTVYTIDDTKSLEQCVRKIAKSETVDVIIHCMAVSDFYVDKVKTMEQWIHELATIDFKGSIEDRKAQIRDRLEKEEVRTVEKLSSKDDIMLTMKRTPKVIGILSELFPKAQLVGFKLLNQVTERELVDVASKLGETYGCRFVVANDMMDVNSDKHKAILVKDFHVIERCLTKDGIAKSIVRYLTNE